MARDGSTGSLEQALGFALTTAWDGAVAASAEGDRSTEEAMLAMCRLMLTARGRLDSLERAWTERAQEAIDQGLVRRSEPIGAIGLTEFFADRIVCHDEMVVTGGVHDLDDAVEARIVAGGELRDHRDYQDPQDFHHAMSAATLAQVGNDERLLVVSNRDEGWTRVFPLRSPEDLECATELAAQLGAEPEAETDALTTKPAEGTAPGDAGGDPASELEEMKKLHEQGDLDDAEFEAVKARLLDRLGE